VRTIDGTVSMQKLLSACYRTGQRYGAQHLIDVLTASRTDRIVERGHDKLPTFGAGSANDKDWWQHVTRQAVAMGLLESPPDVKGGLVITRQGSEVLKGKRTIAIIEPPRRIPKSISGKASAGLDDLPPERKKLFSNLRALRARIANTQGVPPYVIFSDKTLYGMLSVMPRSLEQLRGIEGVGDIKLRKYGPVFLAAINEEPDDRPKPDRIGLPGFGPR
jgi:ATP-dependent DNA helicase RecQ